MRCVSFSLCDSVSVLLYPLTTHPSLSTAAVPPRSVRLRPPAGPLVAGRPVTLTCQVTGSEPAPTVSWRVGAARAPAGRQQASPDGNGTVSRITFTPEVADQGHTVTCGASNPAAGGEVLDDGLTLHIQCEWRPAAVSRRRQRHSYHGHVSRKIENLEPIISMRDTYGSFGSAYVNGWEPAV